MDEAAGGPWGVMCDPHQRGCAWPRCSCPLWTLRYPSLKAGEAQRYGNGDYPGGGDPVWAYDSLLWTGFPYRVTSPALVESRVGHASGLGVPLFLPFASGGKSSFLLLGLSHTWREACQLSLSAHGASSQ